MIYANLSSLPSAQSRRLPFYLAMEEHLARNYSGDWFFMWQVDPTVIYGRCQDPQAEVNLDYCRREGIQTYRRRSGGGCVYADRNNIMFSHITDSREVAATFSHYCRMVADTLQQLGLAAESTGRNDVIIKGRKVSGNAFYHLNGRAIAHGTMLFDADPERMVRAITPSHAKLQAKGVESVRSHITTIREYLPNLDIEDFKLFCRKHLCDSERMMTPEDLREIERLEKAYYSPEWLNGRSRKNARKSIRIEGVGEFCPEVELEPTVPGGPAKIRKVSLTGDFFLLADLDEMLLDYLKGVEYTPQAILNCLKGIDTAKVVAHLSPEQLTGILI